MLALALAAGLTGAQLTSAAAAPSSAVTFADPAFRACVSGELGQPSSAPITKAQAASVTDLYCEVQYVRGLGGAQALTNLASLRWDAAGVFDLTPLAGLTRLRTLTVPNSPVRDLRPLKALTGLTSLTVTGPTTDISPLSSLTRLTYLNLQTWRSLEPLRPLTNLRTLYLGEQEGQVDISALSSLTRLRLLWLRAPDVRDLAPLRKLTGLTELLLTSGPADFSVLKPMTRLQKLSFGTPSGKGRGAKSALRHKPDLVELTVYGARLRSLDALAASTRLEELTVNLVGLRDLGAARRMTELRYVNLTGLEKASVRPLSALPRLTELRILESRLGPLRQFRGFPALTDLYLYKDGLRSLDGFPLPPSLTYLDLESNRLRDLGDLTCAGPRISALDQTVEVRRARVGKPFDLALRATPQQQVRLGSSTSWTAAGTTITYKAPGTYRVPFSASKPAACSDLNTDVDYKGVVVQTARA